MREVNGFQVDKFNQYSIQEGTRVSTCPLCSEGRRKKTDKCLTLNWDKGLGKCFHCGEVLQLHTYKAKKVESYTIPTWTNKTILSDQVVKYFEGRGISQFVLRLMKIGEGLESMPDKATGQWQNKNTIQFPYFRFGNPINIKYRSGDKNFKMFKGSEKTAYNLDNVNGQEVVYWVEGEFDVLAVMETSIHNVTSPPNGFTIKGEINLNWLNNDIKAFDKTKKHILVFDKDEAGQKGRSEFIRRFGSHRCFDVDLKDCKDSNEYLVRYGKESLLNTLKSHLEIPIENVCTAKDHAEELKDFFKNGMPKGYQVGLKQFDNSFSVNTGQIITITGIPSYGKSEFVDQMILGYSLKYDWNIAFASVENKPAVLHTSKLVKKILGYAPTNFNDSYNQCVTYISEHIFNIDFNDGYDLKKTLAKTEELIYSKGIKCLVIDPFNKVRMKESIGKHTNEYTNDYLSLIGDFATKNDILIILVAHPIKMQKDPTGKREMPDFYDIKGGGEFYDMCHHGLCVHRDFVNDISIVKVLKVKFAHLGTNGSECILKYNINNGRLCNVEGSIETDDIRPLFDNANWLNKNEVIQQDYDNIVNNSFYEKEEVDEMPF